MQLQKQSINQNLAPLVVAVIHKFGTLNQHSNESNFVTKIIELIGGNSKYKLMCFIVLLISYNMYH